MRDRIHVESLGQPPALARHQHVEHDARPQLTQVGVRLRAVDHQDTGDLQVTGTGGGLVIIAFQGEAGRLQCPQLAERGRSEAVPVGVDGDRDGPGSATRFWRSALDQCGQGFRTGEAAVRDPGRAGGFQRIARFWRWVWQLLRRCRAWGGGRLRGSTTGCLQPGVLQFAAHGIGPPQQFDIALKPQNLHDRMRRRRASLPRRRARRCAKSSATCLYARPIAWQAVSGEGAPCAAEPRAGPAVRRSTEARVQFSWP